MGSPRATETTINLNCLGLSQRGRKKNGEWGAFSPLCALPERSRNKGLLFFSKRINSPWRISQRCFQQTTARSHLHWRLRHEMIIIQMQGTAQNYNNIFIATSQKSTAAKQIQWPHFPNADS
ncbi:hypothetical protein LSTR_LSTR017436 [Laodelphax striatellus]|uniref:Uncharacterized protein n=1 Tax=Laodelphax striatellus TaxID=195883 RepID=A0A482WG88_LAOST|nr:hypothetical protein LSTR_LSTR017436 [Laodelphax striatellus]